MLTRLVTKRKWSQRTRLVVASAIVAGAAVAFVVATDAFSGTASGGSTLLPSATHISVLDTAPESLPEQADTPAIRQVGGATGVAAHSMLSSGDVTLYAVASQDGSYVCLTVTSTEGATANTCRLASTLTPDDVVWISHAKPGGVYDLFGLAPDGIQSILVGPQQTTVSQNGFVLRNVPASVEDITLDGPSIHKVVHIRAQIPEGVTIAG